MKVLWLSHVVPYPPKGGVLQRSYNLLKELARYHEVHLVSFVQKKLITTHFEDFEEGLNECEKHLSSFCESVSFIPIPSERLPFGQYLLAGVSIFNRLGYTVNWLRSKVFEEKVKSIASGHAFDFVHFDTISLAPYAELVDSMMALDHHNVESHMMKRRAEKEKNVFKKWYFSLEASRLEKYEREVCPRFALNVLCSELDKVRLEEVCGDVNSVVIENGVDTSYFSPARREDSVGVSSPRFIFIGRLSAYTNAAAVSELAFEIWPKIVDDLPAARLDIVGPGASRELVAGCEQSDTIKLHGYVDDVRDYFQQANIYICPMRDGGGTKLKILDAMAMGVPIVATRLACEGIELVDGHSVLFAETADEFVLQSKRLIEDASLRTSLSKNARTLVENSYSFNAIGKSLSDHFISARNNV